MTNEFEVPGGDTAQLDLEEIISHPTGHGWLLVETAGDVVVRPRWHFRGEMEGVWASERTART